MISCKLLGNFTTFATSVQFFTKMSWIDFKFRRSQQGHGHNETKYGKKNNLFNKIFKIFFSGKGTPVDVCCRKPSSCFHQTFSLPGCRSAFHQMYARCSAYVIYSL